MKFVSYHPDHFIEIAPVVKDMKMSKDDFTALAHMHANHPATTALDDNGKVIACFGITPMWRGVVFIWSALGPDTAEKYGMTLYRGTVSFINELLKRYHRIQCEVISTNKTSVRFIKRFGFKREGCMKKYTPDGQDCYLYARVSE